METSAFETALKADGFTDIETKTAVANATSTPHAHPFAVRILVLSGEMTVTRNGSSQTCRAGDTFAMDAGCEHFEQYGPQGSVYVVGKKQPA